MLSFTANLVSQPPSNVTTAVESSRTSVASSQRVSTRESTAKAYAKDVRLFIEAGGSIPCDASLVRRYIEAVGQRIAPTTLHRRLMAIAHAHRTRGLPSPIDDPSIRPLVRSLQLGKLPASNASELRASKSKQHKAKGSLPVTRKMLGTVVEYMHRNMKDRRDRACLLLGFAAALKRSELVALRVDDIRFTADAMIVSIREATAGSVAADTGSGRRVALALSGGELCAGRAVREWIEHAALEADAGLPLFCRFDRGGDPTKAPMSSAWVSAIVKNRLRTAGIDPAPYSAEGLRHGRRLEAAKGVIL